MQNLMVLIVSSLYLLSILSLILSKKLDSKHSFVDNFSLYINNLFDTSLKANVRKVRSNSDQILISEEFDTKHSFTEIPVFGVESSHSSLTSELRNSRTSKQSRYSPGVHQFTPEANINRLKTIGENLFAITRNSGSNNANKVYVRHKILEEFRRNNLISFNQMFVTTSPESNKTFEGINIIGVFPGLYWRTDASKDRILVIGAHYDTVDKTGGVNDNGSGMTVLLEIARLINSYKCDLVYSIIFVALDLEELGAVGSKYFVNNYLIPNQLIEKKSEFEGAIILDTILNFNQSKGSQDIPYDIHKALPHWSKGVRQSGFIGDFLALISRQNIDDSLSTQITNSWNLKERMPFRLSQMSINSLNSDIPDIRTLTNHANLLRSDHIMFWYHNNKHYNKTLKAVLITDTGPFRGYMRDCYHISCDDTKHLSDKNLKFLKLTAEVLTQTAVDITLGKCNSYEFQPN